MVAGARSLYDSTRQTLEKPRENPMHPVLVEIFGMRVPTFGTLLAIAFPTAIFIAAYLIQKSGVPFGRMVDFGFGVAIAGEIGARATYFIVEFDRFAEGAISFKQFMVAGRVVLGGVAAAFICGLWLSSRIVRDFKVDRAAMADAGFTGTAMGMAIGRLGCFMNGCCYGAETDMAWGVTFTDPHAHQFAGTPLGVSLHPTQLLQAGEGLLVFTVCLIALHRSKYLGLAAGLFWVVGGISRFSIEYLRADDRGNWLFGFTTSQWIAIVGVLVGSAWIAYAYGKLKTIPAWKR